MAEGKLQALQSLSAEKMAVPTAAVSKTSEPAQMGARAAGQDWLLCLINMGTHCMIQARTRNSGTANWTGWFAIPRTCQTCQMGNPQACFNNQMWQGILMTVCNSPAFDIQIATEPDAQGNAWGATFSGIGPDCNFGGGVITLTS